MPPLFDPVADAYRRHRPGYPAAILDALDERTGGSGTGPTLDVGCGTGILARALSERGAAVVGVDPSRPMLARAVLDGGGPHYALGAAEALPVRAHSIGRVTVAQALHWFDIAAFTAEVRRVARPGAWAFALWNRRADVGLAAEYDGLMRGFTGRYARQRHGAPTLDQLQAALGADAVTELRVAWTDRLDWDGFIGRARSTSYVHYGEGDRAALEAGLRAAFERAAGGDGRAPFEYEAVAFAWRADAG